MSDPSKGTTSSTDAKPAAAAKTADPEAVEVELAPEAREKELATAKAVWMQKPKKGRGAVSAETGGEAGEVELVTVQKSSEVRTLLANAMQDNLLFSCLDDEQKAKMIDVMYPVDKKVGDIIMKQGDEGDNFYVAESGEYDVLIQTKGSDEAVKVATLGAGKCFGDLALMYNCPRAATIQTLTPGKLYAITRAAYRMIKMATNQGLQETEEFLRNVPSLSQLTREEISKIAFALENESFEPGDFIIRKGDEGNKFYILKEGEVIVSEKTSPTGEGKELGQLKKGEFFGERALMTNDVRAASIIAKGPVSCLTLDRHGFMELLGPLENVWKMHSLRGVEMLSRLTDEELYKVCDALEPMTFEDGKNIITKGENGDTFYIIESGTVAIVGAGDGETTIAKLKKGQYFGERALLTNDVRAASARAVGSVLCLSLNRQAFTDILGPLKDLMEKRARQYEEDQGATRQLKKIDIDELEMVGMLGVGTFGKVMLVRTPEDGHTYALKCLKKAQIVALGQKEHILNERRVLAECESPFLVCLCGTHRDSEYVYMMMEPVLGGELFTVLRTRGCFSDNEAKFYAANVILAFEYLHKKNIAYRDLKPENLLIGSDGYLKLVDFGFAKKIDTRSWTVCGTPDYLPPEIIRQSGHSKAVDWWALGILIYEMLTGDPPFSDADTMVMYEKIMAGRVQYDSKKISKPAQDLISKLLHVQQSKRLGNLKNGVADVKSHRWFKGFDWDACANKTMPAPFIPDIASADDLSNFYEYGEEDDPGKLYTRYVDDQSGWDAEF